MHRTGTLFPQGAQMHRRSIAFMGCETIAGILRVESLHQVVTGHFSKDGGRGNRGAATITPHQGYLSDRKRAHWQPVNQGQIRLQAAWEAPQCKAHRLMRRSQDIDSINLFRVYNPDLLCLAPSQ